MIIIPTDSTGTLHEYAETVRLDGADYWLRFRWSMRIEAWFLSVYTSEGVALVEGRMIVPGFDLFGRCVVQGRPPGALFAAGADGSLEHPDLTGLGSRVQLYYREVSDL